MTKEDILITADLAYIALKEDEMDFLMEEVSRMLEYFTMMEEIDVSDLVPTTHALLKENRLRSDVVSDTNISDDLLENAPELEDRFIVIPNVL